MCSYLKTLFTQQLSKLRHLLRESGDSLGDRLLSTRRPLSVQSWAPEFVKAALWNEVRPPQITSEERGGASVSSHFSELWVQFVWAWSSFRLTDRKLNLQSCWFSVQEPNVFINLQRREAFRKTADRETPAVCLHSASSEGNIWTWRQKQTTQINVSKHTSRHFLSAQSVLIKVHTSHAGAKVKIWRWTITLVKVKVTSMNTSLLNIWWIWYETNKTIKTKHETNDTYIYTCSLWLWYTISWSNYQ